MQDSGKSRAVKPRLAITMGFVFFSVTPGMLAQGVHNPLRGPWGLARSTAGESLEGMMVQLVSEKSSIRTTVFSNYEGRYEFPVLPAGRYELRIVRPLEFRPYQRHSVPVDGSTRLEDIILERITQSEFLSPTPEIAVQLTGVEWLLNLPGTGEERKRFVDACTNCHSYYQIFRNRHEEQYWRMIITRMFSIRHVLSPNTGNLKELPKRTEEIDVLSRFLGRVRGPESKDPPFRALPRPRGAATRMIVTEYEFPHLRLYPKDLAADAAGNIWYLAERAPFIGKLDPRTGIVQEYRIPTTDGFAPVTALGTSLAVDKKKNVIWLAHNHGQTVKLTRFDPQTGTFGPVPLPPRQGEEPVNLGLAPDGSVWLNWDGLINRIDPETGRFIRQYPMNVDATFDNVINSDGAFWASGTLGRGANVITFLDITKGEVVKLPVHTRGASPARGGFDREGNAWFGGRGGVLVKLDTRNRRVLEYPPPTPYATFQQATPDKNGEVWAGYSQGGVVARFNPRTERWIEYGMPEPYVRSQQIWIDNSTDPVTVWYVNNTGIVRLQPLE